MTRRTPVIAGNWKMNTTPDEGKELAIGIASGCDQLDGVEVIVCPPFTGLAAAAEATANSAISVGAQNISSEPSGAFTGEISAAMLEGLVTHVIVGHSERRALYGETDEQIAAKAVAAAAAGLSPIVCVGESLEVRQSGQAIEFVENQLRESLSGYTAWNQLIVAYEPVWAIGTGEAATPQQAQEIIAAIRAGISGIAGDEHASRTRVLYGGSVNSTNIGPFMDRPDIDGALVGGASLKSDEFVGIVEVAARLSAEAS